MKPPKVPLRTVNPPARFRPEASRWKAIVDLRDSPTSKLNSVAVKNAYIAQRNGRLPDDLVLQGNDIRVYLSVSTIASAHTVNDWLDLFISNRSGALWE